MPAPYTDTGMSTGALPSGANPYGIDPQLMALLQQTGALGGSLAGMIPGGPGSATAGGAQFQRQAPYPSMAQGQPNNLLMAILQMRAQEAQALGSPYTQGAQSTAMQPTRYSLLG